MARTNRNTTLDDELYLEIKLLAVKLNLNANDLIEEGMRYVLYKYNSNKVKEDKSTEN